MKHNLILRVIAKYLFPVIALFAFYVQFHGDYGPGGGFQAGVIFAAGFILYAIVYGVDTARKVAPMPLVRALVALGLLGERERLPFNAALKADNNYYAQVPAIAEALRIL